MLTQNWYFPFFHSERGVQIDFQRPERSIDDSVVETLLQRNDLTVELSTAKGWVKPVKRIPNLPTHAYTRELLAAVLGIPQAG